MKNTIVTIGRQYGSGGRLIGKQVARELGIAFYDKELITLTAEKSGFSEKVVAEAIKAKKSSFLYNLYLSKLELPLSDQIYISQFQVIWDLAQQESCVIVGRCADHVLREHPNCAKVFIHAPLEHRVRRIRERHPDMDGNMQPLVQKEDKQRAAYYKHFTQKKWGVAENYHLAVDSRVGEEQTTELIIHLVKGTFL